MSSEQSFTNWMPEVAPVDASDAGTVSIDNCGPFVAGSYQRFTLTYTAGRYGIVLGRNKEACLADETTAQYTLKQNWSKYGASDKSDCVGMVKTGGPASYVELLSCVEILRDARNIRNADPLESDNESVSRRRSRDNGRPVRARRRHPT